MSLTHQDVSLRRFGPRDRVRLAQLCNNPRIWNNLRDDIPFPYREKDAADFIARTQAQEPACTFAITYRRELAGCVGLVLQDDVYRLTAEVGYWLGESYWGGGIATQAVRLITRYGFERLDLRRIYAGVFAHNPASCRVLEKAGYQREALLRQAVVKNGVVGDEVRYARLRFPDPD